MSGFRLFPHFIVRTTGFPFELLERLRCPGAAEAARAWVAAEQALVALERDAPRLRRPPRAVLAALKARRPVPLQHVAESSRFEEWNARATALQAARERLERVLAEEGLAARGALREFFRDARFREALASLSPPVFGDLARGRFGARLERQLAAYLQRLCARNGTEGFFSPVNYGVCESTLPDGVSLVGSGPLVLKGRRTHLASWLWQGLSQKIAFDPQVAPWLVLRRKGFLEPPLPTRHRRLGEILVERGTLTKAQLVRILERQPLRQRRIGELLLEAGLCSAEEVEEALKQQKGIFRSATREDAGIAELLALLVRAVNGSKSLAALSEELGAALPDTLHAARLGCERRFLTHPLELPAASPRPLPELMERLAGIPGAAAREHLTALAEVEARRERYSQASATDKVRMNEDLKRFVEERWAVSFPREKDSSSSNAALASGPAPGLGLGVTKAVSVGAKRAAPSPFVGDRLPMREECGGDLRLSLGGEQARELSRRMEAPLALLGRLAEQTRLRARARVAALLGRKRLPFWKVMAALSDEAIPHDDTLSGWLSHTVSPWLQRFEVEWEKLPDLPLPAGLPILCSVDLLIGAKDVEAWRRGEYEVVIGDIHDTVRVWGEVLSFHEAREQVEADLVRALGGLPWTLPVVTTLSSRRAGHGPAALPGPVIELGGVSARPSAWTLPLDDLWVLSDGQAVQLYSEGLRSEVCLHPGERESLVHAAFALPSLRPPRVELGAHTPRLELGGVVLQREQWRLEPERVQELIVCRDDVSRLKWAAELWTALKLPQYVFARRPGERRPVLVDPSSPLLLRTLANLLEPEGGAVLSEMLPQPAQLWLGAPNARHTAELRCTFLRGASP